MKVLVLLLLFSAAAPAKTYYVTVAGLGGEADYEQRFTAWAKRLDQLLRNSGTDVEVYTLTGADARKQRLKAVLQEIAGKAETSDALALMLIGHGTFDGFEYKMNLPGPDITATELAELLDGIPAERQLVANMTSSSGGSLEVLARPRRIVITATKSGTQNNAVVFARYWVAALEDAAADTDKNEVISALEAFRYATRKTQDYYVQQKRLATEHALLEDTGQGRGEQEPSVENGYGLEARRFALLRIGEAQRAARDPARRALLAKKEALEQAIDKLKYEKAAMPLAEYRARLTQLLLELAKTQKALDGT